jgi:hypothetical protein
MGGSQAGEGDLAHPQETYMSPKHFLLLACLSTKLEVINKFNIIIQVEETVKISR